MYLWSCDDSKGDLRANSFWLLCASIETFHCLWDLFVSLCIAGGNVSVTLSELYRVLLFEQHECFISESLNCLLNQFHLKLVLKGSCDRLFFLLWRIFEWNGFLNKTKYRIGFDFFHGEVIGWLGGSGLLLVNPISVTVRGSYFL